MKKIFSYYSYDNNLFLIVLTGQEIKDLIEYNASERIEATPRGGELYVKTKGEAFTMPVFYGLNFEIDMYKDPGDRVKITGFANTGFLHTGDDFLKKCIFSSKNPYILELFGWIRPYRGAARPSPGGFLAFHVQD